MPKYPVGIPGTFRLVDFSGGWNSSDSPALLSTREAQKADNVSYDMRGTLSPRKGRTKRFTNVIGANRISGLAAIVKKDGTSRLVMVSGPSLYYDEPHMEHRWDTQGEWETAGTAVEGDATTSRVSGSLTLSGDPAKRNMKQKVTLTGSPTGGAFKLTVTPPGYSSQTTANIAYNATATAVFDELVKFSGINGEDTVMDADITATGGTFKLGWKATEGGSVVEWSAAMAYNATTAAVQSALEAMTNIGVGNVTVTGAAKDYTIRFIGTLKQTNLVLMAVDASTLTGTGATATIVETLTGSAPDIAVTGNAGGPWYLELIGQYQYETFPTFTATHTLTGGSAPNVAITVDTAALDLTTMHTYDTDAQLSTGTVSATAVSGNKVVLTRKGADYTKTFDTQADWDGGTKTNVDTAATPGDIKLSVERAAVNIAKTSQADFDLGTKVSVSTTIMVGSVTLVKV